MVTKTSSRTRLTAKQEAFCVNYFTMRNGTQAAIKAGYSPKTAWVIAVENLRKPLIATRIEALREGIASAKQIPERERREVLATIAREMHFLPVTAGNRITAVAELNKMEGSYAPEKHAILGDIVIRVVYEDRKKLEDANTG